MLSFMIEGELREMARDAYNRTRIGHPDMPHPDSEDGQRKIERLFDIISKPFRNADEK